MKIPKTSLSFFVGVYKNKPLPVRHAAVVGAFQGDRAVGLLSPTSLEWREARRPAGLRERGQGLRRARLGSDGRGAYDICAAMVSLDNMTCHDPDILTDILRWDYRRAFPVTEKGRPFFDAIWPHMHSMCACVWLGPPRRARSTPSP